MHFMKRVIYNVIRKRLKYFVFADTHFFNVKHENSNKSPCRNIMKFFAVKTKILKLS